MHIKAQTSRFFLESPLPLLLFSFIPAAFFGSRIFQLQLPFQLSTRMILASVACLLLCVVARLVRGLVRAPRDIRYSTKRPGSKPGTLLDLTAAELRASLGAAGYRFAPGGRYAEKRDLGYWGALAAYAGLLLLSATGIRDNLYQFSGTTIHGMGIPVSLSNPELYYPVIRGPLSSIAHLPLLGINKQLFPSQQYPKGATEIVLLSKEQVPFFQQMIVSMGEPARFRDFDIFLAKLLVDTSLTIKLKEGARPLFEDAVKLSPLLKKEGNFDFYGAFASPEAGEGELYYDSAANVFRVILSRGGKKVLDADYAFQQYREKSVGDYLVRFSGMGRWSELHVVHRRNMALILFGAALAAAGLLVRIAFRPRRVWLEETPQGCRVWGSRLQGEMK
jgi:hypothetical protein